MPKVTYRSTDGQETTIDVEVGVSVMKAAVLNGVDGVIGECGGNLMCATCHVYVDPEWRERSGERDEIEDEMLEEAACTPDERSRLSCQIKMAEDLDGILVQLPESQL